MLLTSSLTSINDIHRISKCINEFGNVLIWKLQAKLVKWGGTLFSPARFRLVGFIMDEPDEGHINNEEGVELKFLSIPECCWRFLMFTFL